MSTTRLRSNPYAVLALFILTLAAGWTLLVHVLGAMSGTSFVEALVRKALHPLWSIAYIAALYVLIMGSLWLFWCRVLKRSFLDLGLKASAGDALRQLAAGLACAALAALLYYGALAFSGRLSLASPACLTVSFLSLNLLSSFALAFTEELLFRGFILRLFMKGSGVLQALAISTVLYAASHLFRSGDASFKLFYFAGLFLIGAVLARGALVFESLYFPVGFHWGLIFIVVLTAALEPLKGFPSSNAIAGLNGVPPAGILLWAILIVIFALVPVIGRSHARPGEGSGAEGQPSHISPLIF